MTLRHVHYTRIAERPDTLYGTLYRATCDTCGWNREALALIEAYAYVRGHGELTAAGLALVHESSPQLTPVMPAAPITDGAL